MIFQLHNKQQNIQINLLLDNNKLKKQLQLLLEIDGEEKDYLMMLKIKYHPKIYQFKDQQDQVNQKLQNVQLDLAMHLSLGLKQPNILRQVMLVKMQPVLCKIRKFIRLNLVKVAINEQRIKNDEMMKNLSDRVQQQVYLQILDAMVGNLDNNIIKQKKLQDLKQGLYNNTIITIKGNFYKTNLFMDDIYYPKYNLTREINEIFNILYSIYYQKIKSLYYNTNDINKKAIENVQEQGIVFLDQIDKLAIGQGLFFNGKGVSTQGVQRDLLPLIQGTIVNSKFGDINTENILFIASGSFSMAKVQDLIPQLLGRLPIRVKLNPIKLQQFIRILKQPQFNLIMQQKQLLQSQGIQLDFTQQAIIEIATTAYEINLYQENTGARRLPSIIQYVIQEISFNAPNLQNKHFIIDANYVKDKVKNINTQNNLQKFLI